jgi:predicted TIM-barrel fold metal-dependent hydrolase
MMTDLTHVALVDIHAHFLTDEYVEAAITAGHAHPDGGRGWPDWSAGRHIELMDQWDVEVAVLSISSPGTHFGDDQQSRRLSRRVNESAAQIRRGHPMRFGHLASLPLPDVEGALAELEYAMDQLDADGVTIQSNAGGIYLGDPRYRPLLQELDRRRTPVLVHPTSPPNYASVSLGRPRPMLEFIFDSARSASDLVFNGRLTEYPHISWIFTHGGGTLPLLAERMELFRVIFGDAEEDADATPSIPELIAGLWFDMAGTPFPHQIPTLANAFGSDRLLYGSDYCWTPAAGAAMQVASVDAAAQPVQDSWRALTTRNAHRLFSRLHKLGDHRLCASRSCVPRISDGQPNRTDQGESRT